MPSEIEVFNRTFPNARHAEGGPRFPTREARLANRLANRVAALERAAMTIPVGVFVGNTLDRDVDD